jgi:RimJ/RimL family protein N-acetyltransferase
MREDMWHEGAYHDTIVMGVLRDEFDASGLPEVR